VTLAERFAAVEGAPVDVDGRLAHMLYELPPIAAPAALRIALRAAGARPEGLRLKARHGRVVVNGEGLDDVVLWSDTAPPEVVAELQPGGRRPMSLRMWNTWRDPQGTMQAWIGDAGMLVDEGEPVVLRCSDGFDRPSFDDLVVELELA
jgi:hypothetical protein